MKAFILAAGEGKRMLPLTNVMPKPLLPFLGKPVIAYNLARLKLAGIRKIIINLYHQGDKIRDFMAHHNDFGFEVIYSEESTLLGTGGGIANCSSYLAEPFVLLNADIISDLDLNELQQHFFCLQNKSLLALSDNGHKSVTVHNGRIIDFSGLNGSERIDNVAYFGNAVLSPEIFDHLPAGKSNLVSAGFIPLLKSNSLDFVMHNGWWFDLGTKDRIAEAEKFLQTKKWVSEIFTFSTLKFDQEYLDRMYSGIVEV